MATISMNNFIDSIKKLYSLASEYKPLSLGKTKNHLVASFCRRASYNDFKWVLTGGNIDYDFVEYVKNKNISLYNMFNNVLFVTDYSGAKVDATHLFATITGHLLGVGVIRSSWSGWVGDLASSIKEILRITNNSSSFQALAAMSENYLFSDAGKFSKDDLNADVDAEYIANLMNMGKSIDVAIETYYRNIASSRYITFINNHGGNDYHFDSYVFSEMQNRDSLYLAFGFSPTSDQIYAITGTFISKLRRLL